MTYDTVGAVAERPTAALRVAGSIPAQNKDWYGLQVVVPGLAVCVCDFSMFVNHRCYFIKKKNEKIYERATIHETMNYK